MVKSYVYLGRSFPEPGGKSGIHHQTGEMAMSQNRRIRVLVVDDSILIREMISDLIEEDPNMDLVAKAKDGRQALDLVDEFHPDIVTLDIEMPGMDGLTTLDEILKRRPTPVIMVSSQTQRGADVTLNALDRGALDYVAKPANSRKLDGAFKHELLKKIRAMAGTDVKRMLEIRRTRRERPPCAKNRMFPAVGAGASSPSPELAKWCIAIGISTGGPPALTELFERLQPPLPPVVVVQHMPAHFTGPFARRLDSVSALSIKEAATGDVLRPDHVYIAAGGQHLQLQQSGSEVKVRVRAGEPVSGHMPSVDVMMQCVAEIYGTRVLGAVMTGMGRDGADGCGMLRAAGAYVLGQDEASSDVYGMNKVAFVEGHVDKQFSLSEGADEMMRQIKRLLSASEVGV